jgi:hypothetical protein
VQAANELQIIISESSKNLAVKKLKQLMVGTTSGIFKKSLCGHTSNTYTAFEMLLSMSEGKEKNDFVMEFFENVLNLVSNGGSDIEVDPTLIVILSKVSDKKLRLSPSRLLILSESLLSLTLVDDINIVTRAVEGLHIISTYKSAPFFVCLSRDALVVQKESPYELKLVVVDIFGNAQKLIDAEVASIKSSGKDSMNLQITRFENGLVTLPFDVVSSGKFSANFILNIEGRQKSVVVSNVFVVTDQTVVTDISIGVMDNSSFKPELMFEIAENNKLPSMVGSALNSEGLYVKFTLKSENNHKIKKPQQSVVSLTNSDTGKVSIFIAHRVENDFENKLAYEVRFSLKDELTFVLLISGVYSIAILVADLSFDFPVKVEIGTIDIKIPPLQSLNLPLYTKSLLDTSDTTVKSLPEIVHLMRPDAVKASQLMSAVFASLTLIPLIAFVAFLWSLHANTNRLVSVNSVLLVICFTTVLILFIGYWLALDGVSFYQTIKYMSVVFPVMIVIGRYSLSSVSTLRIASDDKAK